jgi:hypothetical protein
MRTSVRVTSGGSPYVRFRRALDSGNLTLVRAAAAELPRVELGDALRIVWLMRDDDQLYERACVRWLGRFCLEAPQATLDLDGRHAAGGRAQFGPVQDNGDPRDRHDRSRNMAGEFLTGWDLPG